MRSSLSNPDSLSTLNFQGGTVSSILAERGVLADRGIKKDVVWDGAKGKNVQVYKGISLSASAVAAVAVNLGESQEPKPEPDDPECPF
jgi:hypothetical protein